MSHKFSECFIWYFEKPIYFFLREFSSEDEEEEKKTFTLIIIPCENDVKILMLIKWKMDKDSKINKKKNVERNK